MKFSVLLSVYKNDNSLHLKEALNSLSMQSLLPDELVIVKDGELPDEINHTLIAYEKVALFPIIYVENSTNLGLGLALRRGLKYCSYDIVARMDSDDICFNDRFQTELAFLNANEEISVVGTFISEFNEKVNDLERIRSLPTAIKDIKSFAAYRNPLNHMTVVFRKADIIKVGSYMNMPFFEDYYLWARLLQNGFLIGNIPIPLMHVRVGNDMVGRRHGWSYLKYEWNFLKAIKDIGLISVCQFINAIILKLPLRVIPKFMLEIIYKKVLR